MKTHTVQAMPKFRINKCDSFTTNMVWKSCMCNYVDIFEGFETRLIATNYHLLAASIPSIQIKDACLVIHLRFLYIYKLPQVCKDFA